MAGAPAAAVAISVANNIKRRDSILKSLLALQRAVFTGRLYRLSRAGASQLAVLESTFGHRREIRATQRVIIQRRLRGVVGREPAQAWFVRQRAFSIASYPSCPGRRQPSALL